MNKAILANLNLGVVIPKGIEPPSLSFQFNNVPGYSFSLAGSLGSGISLGIEKEIPRDGSSSFGYKCDLNLGTQTVGISPTVMYEVNRNINLSASMGVDLMTGT